MRLAALALAVVLFAGEALAQEYVAPGAGDVAIPRQRVVVPGRRVILPQPVVEFGPNEVVQEGGAAVAEEGVVVEGAAVEEAVPVPLAPRRFLPPDFEVQRRLRDIIVRQEFQIRREREAVGIGRAILARLDGFPPEPAYLSPICFPTVLRERERFRERERYFGGCSGGVRRAVRGGLMY